MTTEHGRNRGYGTLSADGDTDVIRTYGPVVVRAHGGGGNNFGGGTITWYRKGFDGTWRAIQQDGADLAYTANDEDVVDIVGANRIKGTLSGSASPTLEWEIDSNYAESISS